MCCRREAVVHAVPLLSSFFSFTFTLRRVRVCVLALCPVFLRQPALVAFDGVVKEKVALVCVMELASQRPPSNKSIPFADIAAATRLPVDQVRGLSPPRNATCCIAVTGRWRWWWFCFAWHCLVGVSSLAVSGRIEANSPLHVWLFALQVEWVLMRAMSLGLVKGSIDEVDQVVHVTYIKVRSTTRGSTCVPSRHLPSTPCPVIRHFARPQQTPRALLYPACVTATTLNTIPSRTP